MVGRPFPPVPPPSTFARPWYVLLLTPAGISLDCVVYRCLPKIKKQPAPDPSRKSTSRVRAGRQRGRHVSSVYCTTNTKTSSSAKVYEGLGSILSITQRNLFKILACMYVYSMMVYYLGILISGISGGGGGGSYITGTPARTYDRLFCFLACFPFPLSLVFCVLRTKFQHPRQVSRRFEPSFPFLCCRCCSCSSFLVSPAHVSESATTAVQSVAASTTR